MKQLARGLEVIGRPASSKLLFSASKLAVQRFSKQSRESNNIEIEELNKQLGNIVLELNGTFKWTKCESHV